MKQKIEQSVFETKVQSLRRVVIPPAVAAALNISKGDTVRVTISKEVEK